MTTQQGLASPDTAGRELLDVVVIGGSQAGLAVAWHLARQGLRFVVLDVGPELGHVWRGRWDSLRLFTPAQYDALPGMPFPVAADTYPTKDPVADYLQAYAEAYELPVKLNARVTRLSRLGTASRSAPPPRPSAHDRWWWPQDRSRFRSSQPGRTNWTRR
jgi:putative flavoprotein involved in K+ transport